LVAPTPLRAKAMGEREGTRGSAVLPLLVED
jgi:hypothetical protein